MQLSQVLYPEEGVFTITFHKLAKTLFGKALYHVPDLPFLAEGFYKGSKLAEGEQLKFVAYIIFGHEIGSDVLARLLRLIEFSGGEILLFAKDDVDLILFLLQARRAHTQKKIKPTGPFDRGVEVLLKIGCHEKNDSALIVQSCKLGQHRGGEELTGDV